MQGISIGKVKTLSIRSRSMQFDDDSSLFSKIAVLFMKLSKIPSPNVIPILEFNTEIFGISAHRTYLRYNF